MLQVSSPRVVYLAKMLIATGTPLQIKGQPPIPEAEIIRDPITERTIYECIASPEPADISTIVDKLLATSDVVSCLSLINSLKQNKGLALADIISSVAEELTKLDVPAATLIVWLDGLAEVEWRLAGGGSDAVQTGAVVGVIRQGVELMAK
jgi:replication factor C subunit 3/5